MDLPILQQETGAKDFRSAQYEQLNNINVGNAATPLGEIPVNGDAGSVQILVKNTGAAAFTAFDIGAIPTPNAPVGQGNVYPTYITTTQLHTGTPIQDLLIAVSTDPTVLAAGAECLITIKANGAWRLQPRATCGTATTAVITAGVSKSN